MPGKVSHRYSDGYDSRWLQPSWVPALTPGAYAMLTGSPGDPSSSHHQDSVRVSGSKSFLFFLCTRYPSAQALLSDSVTSGHAGTEGEAHTCVAGVSTGAFFTYR